MWLWVGFCLNLHLIVSHSVVNTVRRYNYTFNIWEFVYFLWGLSPPKRRVVRRRNFARRRVPTMCRTCAGFYVYRRRRYENNGIFLKKMRACRHRQTFVAVTSGNGSVGGTVVIRPIPAIIFVITQQHGVLSVMPSKMANGVPLFSKKRLWKCRQISHRLVISAGAKVFDDMCRIFRRSFGVVVV